MRGAKAKMLRRLARAGEPMPERKYQKLKIHHLVQMPAVERRPATRTRYVRRVGGVFEKVTEERMSLAGRHTGGRFEPVVKTTVHTNPETGASFVGPATYPEAIAGPLMLEPKCQRWVAKTLKRLFKQLHAAARTEERFVQSVYG